MTEKRNKLGQYNCTFNILLGQTLVIVRDIDGNLIPCKHSRC